VVEHVGEEWKRVHASAACEKYGHMLSRIASLQILYQAVHMTAHDMRSSGFTEGTLSRVVETTQLSLCFRS
jgi:hypothetical protein